MPCCVGVESRFVKAFFQISCSRRQQEKKAAADCWWCCDGAVDHFQMGSCGAQIPPRRPPPSLPRPLRNKTWPLVPVWEWQPWIMHWLCLTYKIIKWRIKKLLVWNQQAMTCGSTAVIETTRAPPSGVSHRHLAAKTKAHLALHVWLGATWQQRQPVTRRHAVQEGK